MQTHLKERLTGAALLVLIVALLVPEMFRGHPTATPQSTSSALDGPPVRSYTIDLRDNEAAQPLPGGAPLSASPAQSASAPAATEGSAVAPPAPSAASAPRPAAVTPLASAPAHAAAPAGWT
ncbi:MAG TPA: hypothetical protein VK505_01475, partial [Steroidobacteraceae bacterium]|nr:hypothetical protein [Steroidobacteraceae bacterium]